MYAPRMDDYIDFTGSNKAILSSRKEMTPWQYMSEVIFYLINKRKAVCEWGKFLFNKQKKEREGIFMYILCITCITLYYHSNK